MPPWVMVRSRSGPDSVAPGIASGAGTSKTAMADDAAAAVTSGPSDGGSAAALAALGGRGRVGLPTVVARARVTFGLAGVGSSVASFVPWWAGCSSFIVGLAYSAGTLSRDRGILRRAFESLHLTDAIRTVERYGSRGVRACVDRRDGAWSGSPSRAVC